jgi:hypothetical protein
MATALQVAPRLKPVAALGSSCNAHSAVLQEAKRQRVAVLALIQYPTFGPIGPPGGAATGGVIIYPCLFLVVAGCCIACFFERCQY